MNRIGHVILGIILVMSAGCAIRPAPESPEYSDPDFDQLIDWMTGSFSSEAQSAADEDYFDIRLEMIRIWPDRTDGAWLYIEQAVSTHLEKPYRQRIYHVIRLRDDLFESQVFQFQDPLRFAGVWNDENPMQSLSPEDLELKEGCSIILRKLPDRFVGNTVGKTCASGINNAAYASSEVEITAERLTSWDRGFDSADQQVWGAVAGGYIFDKVKNY